MHKYGYIKDTILPEHYIFGAAQIQAPVLQPGGQWDAYLPPDEFQDLNGIEPYACASFGTLNCIETLRRRLFLADDAYSDRYTAKVSGTDVLKGNSPHTVAEYIRKVGTVLEATWPFDQTIDTFAKFYAKLPTSLATVASLFNTEHLFQHDWVPTAPASLKEALKYSPLGISVYAWMLAPTGSLFVKPPGTTDNHFVMLYGYVDGQYWKIFDSYNNSHKRLAWNFGFEMAKRYHIERITTVSVPLWRSIWNVIASFLYPTVPVTIPPAPLPVPSPHMPRISTWALAIQHQEGGKPTDLNTRNRNPGNLKYSPYTASLGGKPGPQGSDGGRFCIFDTYQVGFKALCQFLTDAANDELKSYHQARTLDAFTTVYARPPSKAYVNGVAAALGVPITINIHELL